MAISIEIAPYMTTVTANLAVVDVAASSVIVTPSGSITATDLQTALDQLASQSYQQSAAPTGSNVDQGDTWYNTDTEQFYAYRETSPGTLEWVPIILGNSGQDSDTLDAGAF